MRIDDGGTAFPCEQGHTPDGTWNQTFDPGMSLRDYFAAAALTGLLAYPDSHLNCGTAEKAARSAFEIADAMLKARACSEGRE